MAADLFYWSRLTLVFLVGITVLHLLLKPKKEIARPAVLAGVVMSIANFIIEASAGILGVWMYQGGDIFFLIGIPINVLFHFTASGYAFIMINNEVVRRFGSRLNPRNISILMILAVSLFSTLGDFGYEIQGIIYFSPWWTPGHIFFVWLFLYTLDVLSFNFFKKKIS